MEEEVALRDLHENHKYKMVDVLDFEPPQALGYLIQNYRNQLNKYLILVDKHTVDGKTMVKFRDPDDDRPAGERFYLQMHTGWLRQGNDTLFVREAQGGGRKRKARRRTNRRRKTSRRR
jgi:hypothetical protein